MSDQAPAPSETEHPAPTATLPEPLFDREELAQFDQDDVKAGSVIGKMLALFFVYTVVVMSLAAWWTISAVGD